MAKPQENILVRTTTGLIDEIDQFFTDVDQSFLSLTCTPLLLKLKSCDKVHLISRASGKALQILSESSSKQLQLDANGDVGNTVYNSQWEVVRESKTLYRFHNDSNFLAIKNGTTCLMTYHEVQHAGPETLFTIEELGSSFVRLHGKIEQSCRVGAKADGTITPADKTKRDTTSAFVMRLINTHAYLSKQESYPPTTGLTTPKEKPPLPDQSSPSGFADLNHVNSHMDDEPDRYWGGHS